MLGPACPRIGKLSKLTIEKAAVPMGQRIISAQPQGDARPHRDFDALKSVKEMETQSFIESVQVDDSLEGSARFEGIERLDYTACLRCCRSKGIPIGTEAIVADPGEVFFVIGAVWGAKPQAPRATRMARSGILG
jgi:hypothetical protein